MSPRCSSRDRVRGDTSANVAMLTTPKRERRPRGSWCVYIFAGSSYLWLREFPAGRLVITVVVIGPETGGRARPITASAIFRPVPLKPGDTPRHIRHLHRRPLAILCPVPRAIPPLRKNGDHPRNLPDGCPARRTLAIALHGICPI